MKSISISASFALIWNSSRRPPMPGRNWHDGFWSISAVICLRISMMRKKVCSRACARALPEDELDKTLNRLAREHEIAEAAFALLVPALACMADGALPAPEDRDALCRLAASERRHLIVENAILLPLARLRLTDKDKSALMAEMCERRHQPPRMDSACARALARIDPASLGDK